MEDYIAEVRLMANNFPPRNWAFCHGQLLPIAQNTALFSLIGNLYGGDGRTTFALPDLRGRTAIGSGSGIGVSYKNLGSKGGVEEITLNILELPAHNHFITMTGTGITGSAKMKVNGSSSQGNNPANNYLGVDQGAPVYASSASGNDTLNANAITVTINEGVFSGTAGSTGGSKAHNNVQPFQSVNYMICLAGIFPSRN